MEHTTNIMEKNKGIISSLLKVFEMFEFRLIGEKEKLDVTNIMGINCKKEAGSYLQNPTLEEMITKFVLNAILHYVSMSWILSPNNEMKYEIDELNHKY